MNKMGFNELGKNTWGSTYSHSIDAKYNHCYSKNRMGSILQYYLNF